MNNKKFIKYTSGMTALALTLSLGMGGCSSAKSNFNYTENENGEVVVAEDSYIEYDCLDKYCILEVYNSITNETELYIARKKLDVFYNYYKYKNIFNDFTIVCYGNNYSPNNGLEYVKETPLLGYITSYYTLKTRYTYEDMEKIFEIVKENYKFENDNALRRKLVIDNRI